MDLPAPRAAALALILLGGPACRGCVVDDPTYAAAGGSGSTSTTDASSTATSSSGDGGASTATSSSSATTSSTTSAVTTGGEGAGGATGSSTTGAGGDGGSPAGCPRSDDFDDGLHECWVRMNEGDATVTEVGGAIELVPEEGTGWYDDDDGIFVYQNVVGDFSATLRVDTATVEGTYQLAGLLLRDPTPGPEDWIKTEVGRNVFIDTSVYVGFTVESVTEITYNDGDDVGSSVLGVCRRGDSIVLAGNQGEGWFPYRAAAFDPDADAIPDFPASIQVGFNAASTTGVYVATIDDFRLDVGSSEACLDVLEQLWSGR